MKTGQRIQKGFGMAGLAVLGLVLAAQPAASVFATTARTEKAPTQPELVTYTVSNTNNSGAGSLREAIELANANSGKDRIVFDIQAGSGVRTIVPVSPLPAITSPVELDATTQPGYAGTPVIELNGSSASLVQAGLVVSGSGRDSTIKGLAINRFNGAGIKIVETGNVTLEGNFIGTNPAGTVAQGNAGPGIYMEWAGSNIIGGTTASARNLISGNGGNGITIQGVGVSESNQILGNYIGTNISGTAALGNGGHGVSIQNSNGNVVGQSVAGARNLISGNGGSGVWISGSTYFNKVQGNYIGTDATGTARLGNGVNGVTVRDGAFWNNIGGVGTEGNLISGNVGNGVVITATGQVVANTVSGNYIGTNLSGTAPLSNTINGVLVDNASGNHIGGFVEGHRNIISGNWENGVVLFGAGSKDNKVQVNYIGTNASGTLSLGNRYRGVLIVSGSSNIIGGTTPELRNLISGNGDSGIDIRSQQYNQFASNNVIQGNYIGTDATGTAAVGNQFAGVNLTSWTSGTLLGGPEVGARNLISGNPYYGIVMFNANGSKIQNNYIGTNASGTGPLGNGITAIHMSDSYTNTIGGAVGLGNLIAYNGNGIEIDSGEGNVINTNSIHSNTRYGIDLRIPTEVEGGPTPNDALDPDGGPNRLQNFPVLSANSTQSQIKGSMNSLPNTMFTIEFFANDTCDSTGYGEGKTFLGTTSATTAGNGNASFTFEPDAPVPGGTYITSTATDPSGNTSEFSACLLIQGPPTATPTNTAIPSATSTNTVVPSATSTVTGGNPSATVTRTATSTSSNPSPTATSQVPGDCQVSFTDVPEGSTFYQYVQCLACKGILGGYSDGTFRTNNDVTRGQLSKIVSNAAGFNEAVSGQTFSDVAPDSPFYAYVERMVSRGIISGYGDGTFRPNANATRGQISKIVANARSYTEPVSGQTFSDVAPDSPFYAYIERMVSRGIISGYGDGTFRPNANATRGQTAKIVSNAFFPNCQPAN
jgi:hypothetical protein